jgi:hypothetical protein
MHINIFLLQKLHATDSNSILKNMERFTNKERFWTLILHCTSISSSKIEIVL